MAALMQVCPPDALPLHLTYVPLDVDLTCALNSLASPTDTDNSDIDVRYAQLEWTICRPDTDDWRTLTIN